MLAFTEPNTAHVCTLRRPSYNNLTIELVSAVPLLWPELKMLLLVMIISNVACWRVWRLANGEGSVMTSKASTMISCCSMAAGVEWALLPRLKNTVRQQHITQTNTVHTIHPQPNGHLCWLEFNSFIYCTSPDQWEWFCAATLKYPLWWNFAVDLHNFNSETSV